MIFNGVWFFNNYIKSNVLQVRLAGNTFDFNLTFDISQKTLNSLNSFETQLI